MANNPRALDAYLPATFRAHLEQEFYAKVNDHGRLEHALEDPGFVRAPFNHPILFSDHGVVHVRDVAQQVLRTLEVINGVLIPARDVPQLHVFMSGYGVLLAYLHDIGMRDYSVLGRTMHPEFASQYVFSREFDPWLAQIWQENSGNIAWRLLNLHADGHLSLPPKLVLREMLALSNCHSKSKVPVDVLNDPAALRATMKQVISTDLTTLYYQHQARVLREKLNAALHHAADEVGELAARLHAAETALAAAPLVEAAQARHASLSQFYEDFDDDAYSWLTADVPAVREMVEDVVDTLRALRCADALRQRGTVLKTSGSYEIFVDQMTASAIFALRKGAGQLFILEMPSPIPAGEANLASSELGRDGNLYISFQRGAFRDAATVRRAAYYAATVVSDIRGDVIESLRRPDRGRTLKAHDQIEILLEGVDDNLDFADMVADELRSLNGASTNPLRAVPSLQGTTPHERERYLSSPPIDWADAPFTCEQLFERLAASGQKVDRLDPTQALEDVRLVQLHAGELLIEAGTPASFVYIPLDEGLRVLPLGGYESFAAPPWLPLGTTGVIRGAIRNATVIGDRDMQLLMIPKQIYLKHWHHPYQIDELLSTLLGHDADLDGGERRARAVTDNP